MKIYIMRHAETDSNKNRILGDINEDINENGILQAKAAISDVENMNFDIIISSPSPRTISVANIVNTKNIPLIYDDRLIERDLGIYEYEKWDKIDKIDFWNYYPKKHIELESMKDLHKRVESL